MEKYGVFKKLNVIFAWFRFTVLFDASTYTHKYNYFVWSLTDRPGNVCILEKENFNDQ